MVAVGPAVEGRRPQCLLGIGPGPVDLGGSAHLAIALESEPVATARELAEIADRTAADQLGQLEDLGDGQDRALWSLFTSRSPDAAGIAREDLVLFDCGHQHCAQE